MKAAFVFAAGAALVAAQELSSLAPCGQTCVTNMLALASELGCDSPDASCLCQNADFGYGIRDCATAACSSQDDAQAVIAYGVQYCSGVLSGGSSGSSDMMSATGTMTGTDMNASSDTMSMTGSSASEMVTTAPLVAVVQTDDGSSFTTTTGFTTITGTGAMASATDSAGNAISSATESASAALSSASESASGALSSASESVSGALNSASAAASSAIESASSKASAAISSATGAAGSATSSAGASLVTAAPMVGAFIAALFAI